MKLLFVQKVKGLAGSEKYFLNLFPGLLSKGHEVEFVVLFEKIHLSDIASFTKELQKLGVRTHLINTTGYFSLTTLNGLRKTISNSNPDIVHSHLIHADFYCSLVKMLFQSKLVLVSTKHGYDESFMQKFGLEKEKPVKSLYYLIARFSEKWINRSFAVSMGLRDLFVRYGIAKSGRIDTIFHGIKIEGSLPLISERKEKKLNLLILGRLFDLKGHEFALGACYRLKQNKVNFELNIAGSGEHLNYLQELTKELGLSGQVNFMGYVDNPNSIIANSDVVLVPSKSEGFGLVAIEAFAFKKPVICFDVAALNEVVINEFNGFVIPPFDVELFAEKLQVFYNDPQKRIEFGNNAYDTLKDKFSIDKMVDTTLEFYSKCLPDTEEETHIGLFCISLQGGGAEKVLSILANYLVAKYKVTLFLLENRISYSIPENVEVVVLQKPLIDSELPIVKFFDIPFYIKQLAKEVRNRKIHTLLSFLNRPNYIACGVKKNVPGLKVVVSERSYSSLEYEGSSFQNRVSKYLIRRQYPKADLIITNSKATGKDLNLNFGISENKLRTIYNPVKTGIDAVNRNTKINDEVTFLCIGRLDKNKNHQLVLRALSNIKDQVNFRLLIIGDGKEKTSIQELSKELGIENRVKIFPFTSDLQKYYQQADIFILSSLHEGFPNVLLESMIYSLPIISSDCLSGPRELLAPNSNEYEILSRGFAREEFGILYTSNNIQSLSDAILNLVHDAELLSQYASKSKDRIKDFELNTIAEYFEKEIV
tara:strand:- start:25595 stop:27883 length:2289 start_codon:yes stop_codon:yes gene_type:complete